MDRQMRGTDRAEYLKGDTWKCSSSPTGAHHWIIGRKVICKHCHTVQQIQEVQSDKDAGIHTSVT